MLELSDTDPHFLCFTTMGKPLIILDQKCGLKQVRNKSEMELKVVKEWLLGLRGPACFHQTLLSVHCIFSFPSWTKERWSWRKRPGSPGGNVVRSAVAMDNGPFTMSKTEADVKGDAGKP